jgi:hypothetical protein
MPRPILVLGEGAGITLIKAVNGNNGVGSHYVMQKVRGIGVQSGVGPMIGC